MYCVFAVVAAQVFDYRPRSRSSSDMRAPSILCSKELAQVADVVWKGNWNSESILTAIALV